MGIFDGVLLCVDFDDTLAVEGEVSAQNAAAIRYFTGNGGKFTIVSGRNIRFFIEKYPAYGTNAPLVGFNGARIYDPEKGAFIYEGGATGLDMFEFMRPFWEKDTRIRSLWVHSFAMRLWRLRRDVAPTAIDQAKARAALPLYNLICGTSAADSAAVRDALLAAANGRYAIARSHEEAWRSSAVVTKREMPWSACAHIAGRGSWLALGTMKTIFQCCVPRTWGLRWQIPARRCSPPPTA